MTCAEKRKEMRRVVAPVRSMLPHRAKSSEVAAALGVSQQTVDLIEVSALYKIITRLREARAIEETKFIA